MLVELARVVVFCTVGRNASDGAGKNKEQPSWATPSTIRNKASGTVVLDLFSGLYTNLVPCVGVSDFLDNVVGTTYLRESCGLEDLLFVSKPPAAVSCTYSSLCVGPGLPVGTPPHKTNELHQNRSFRTCQFPAKSDIQGFWFDVSMNTNI